MIKKLILLVIFILLSLLIIHCNRSTNVSHATELDSQTDEQSSDDDNKKSNPLEESEVQSKDDQTNNINDMQEINDNEDEISILEDLEDRLVIQGNEIISEDIKNLEIFNKYGKVLKIGDEGEFIKSLHILLKWLNYDVDDTSSIFTHQTEEAVIKFQKDHSMKGIGIVDKLTYIRLNDFIYSSKIEYDYIDYNVKMGPTEDYWIIINKTTNVLQLYKGKNRLNIYPIATGRYHSFTPEGKFEVANKLINAAWKQVPGGVASNPLGSRWMGLSVKNNWTYGIHGCGRPESIGTYASAGCIRMYNFQAEALYDLISVHTPVWIGTTDKIEEWIMELNKAYDDLQKKQAESKEKLYEDVMIQFLDPYINEAIVKYYGASIASTSKTVEIISIDKVEEQNYVVTIIIELWMNKDTNIPIGKDQIKISIEFNDVKVEAYEYMKSYHDGENGQ